MTVDELAEYLQVSNSTIYKLLRTGHLPFLKIGSDYRVDRHEIDRWIKDQQPKGWPKKERASALRRQPERRLRKGGQTPASAPLYYVATRAANG